MALLPNEIKEKIVNNLWLPLATRGGEKLYPLKRKHKEMKLLTLTDMNCLEVKKLGENKLTKNKHVIAWHHSYHQALRIETELGPSKVISTGRFDDVIAIDGNEIFEDLPCDLFNLDFFSQTPNSLLGRLEKEINSSNVIVRHLRKLETKGFVILHTTLIDQVDVNINNLAFPLSLLNTLVSPITTIENRIEFVRIALGSVLHNNDFDVIEVIEEIFELQNGDRVFSIGYIALRRI